MSRSALLLAGSTLIFGIACAYLWQAERAAEERNAALEARVKELETALATAQSQPIPALATPVVAQAAPVDSPPSVKPAGASAVVSAPANLPQMGFAPFRSMRMDKMLEDPEYRAAMHAQHRMMMSSRYPDLGQALNLQPEEVDKLLDLLTDQEIANMSRRPPFADNGQPADPAAMREWSDQAQQRQRDNEAAIASLIGDGGLQEWKDYQQTLGARMQVKQLRGIMDSSSDPIRADQVQPLVDAIAAEQRGAVAGNAKTTGAAPGVAFATVATAGGTVRNFSQGNQVAMMEQSLEQTEQYNQRMHDAVAPYLSARQLEQFDKNQKQQLEMQRARLRMMQATAEAEARGEIPSNNGGTSMSARGMFVPATP